jgi:hypothetical protein
LKSEGLQHQVPHLQGTTRRKMAMEVGRGLTLPLLVLNFCLYLIAACLAGWALNKNIDSSVGSSYYVGRIFLPHPLSSDHQIQNLL